MKKLLVTLAAVLVGVSTFAQGTVGTIQFNNRLTGRVDAPITLPGGAGFGTVAGAQAQLFQVTTVGGVKTYTPLTPATTFRTGAAAAYVQEPPTAVTVPGTTGGQSATVVVRAWAGGNSYNPGANQWWGESNEITVTLGGTPAGGGAPLVDAALIGMTTFSVIPEPSTMALGLLGAAALLYRRRK